MMPPSTSFHETILRHNQERITPWEIQARNVLKVYKPKCIVLDLDFTLWPTFFSANTLPPYIPLHGRPSQVLCVDKKTHKPRMLSLYPEVIDTIMFCLDNEIMVSIASKNSNRDDAQAILRSLGIWHLLHFPQIFQNRKTFHFRNLKNATHFDYDEFMFFDDDVKNVSACNNIGVHGFRVSRASGFNGDVLLRALQSCALRKTMLSTSCSGRRRGSADDRVFGCDTGEGESDGDGEGGHVCVLQEGVSPSSSSDDADDD